jgi:hypothetical protein
VWWKWVCVDIISHEACPIVTPRLFFLFLRYSNFSKMRLTVKTSGKGGFAILGDVKVKKGSVCSLKRNGDNLHG